MRERDKNDLRHVLLVAVFVFSIVHFVKWAYEDRICAAYQDGSRLFLCGPPSYYAKQGK